MKKIIIFLICAILCFGSAEMVFAAQDETTAPAAEEQVTQNASQPRLMVTSFKTDTGSVTPGKKTKLNITFKNFSSSKAVSNIKLSILDESGDIKPVGMGTAYVDKIKAKSTYVWSVVLTASAKAETGEHHLTVTAEYEDKYFTPYSSTDTVSLNVAQTTALDYNALILPAKVTIGDTETVTPTVFNTGKSLIRNCKIDFDIEGLDSGGTLFIGEIPAGESKSGSANLRVTADSPGKTQGTATITYEDEFGKTYESTVDLATVVEKEIEQAPVTEEEKSNNTLWWLFIIIGLAAGGAVGYAVPAAIRAKKQREEDEKRL